jgi:hypothetical protein
MVEVIIPSIIWEDVEAMDGVEVDMDGVVEESDGTMEIPQ